LFEAPEEDIDFDPAELEGISLTPVLKKMLNPDVPPAKYVQLDAELDDNGNPNQQGFALAAFALSYADGDPNNGAMLLKKGLEAIKKIEKAKQKSAEADVGTPAPEGEE